MTFVIKRDNELNQFIGGYDKYLGIPFISNYPYHFNNKKDAQEIAKSINMFALLEDDAYRFEVFEIDIKDVIGTALAKGEASSAYNKRKSGKTSHEVNIEG